LSIASVVEETELRHDLSSVVWQKLLRIGIGKTVIPELKIVV